MASLRDIQRRIASVKSTQKITRAMKMVAAAKLRRAQEGIVTARPYANQLQGLIAHLTDRAEEGAHPLLRKSTEGKAVIAVFSADRGLCGGFNSSIINKTVSVLRDDFAGKDAELILIGRKGIELMKRRGHAVRAKHTGLLDTDIMEGATSIVDSIVPEFISGEIGAFYCLFNEFRSALVQTATLQRLLPFDAAAQEEAKDGPIIDYVYEPSVPAVLEQLLIHHLYIQVHRIMYESAASEHGARMTAMESATNNAGDMIDRLTLAYNRARQDAITTEMIEIIGGAEAL